MLSWKRRRFQLNICRLLSYQSVLAIQGPHNPNPKVVISVFEDIPRTIRGTEIPWLAAPCSAPHDPTPAITTQPRRTILRGTPIAVIPAVLDPLPDIAVNIVYAKGICRKTADGQRFLAIDTFPAVSIPCGAVKVCLIRSNRRPIVKRRPCTRPGRILPLRLTGQAVFMPGPVR